MEKRKSFFILETLLFLLFLVGIVGWNHQYINTCQKRAIVHNKIANISRYMMRIKKNLTIEAIQICTIIWILSLGSFWWKCLEINSYGNISSPLWLCPLLYWLILAIQGLILQMHVKISYYIFINLVTCVIRIKINKLENRKVKT